MDIARYINLSKKMLIDKNNGARVANIQKKKILGMVEEVEPFTQLNQEDIQQ